MLLLLSSGCSAPVNVEPLAPMMRQLAEVTMALSAAAISFETNQTSGRDMTVNDPWIGRIAIIATSIISTLVIYVAGVRPARQWIVNKIKNGGP